MKKFKNKFAAVGGLIAVIGNVTSKQNRYM
jgi:hypothetical protein